jgi:cellulose biosynthesis protein BcsQ
MRPRIALNGQDDESRLALVKAFEACPSRWDVFLWTADRGCDLVVGDPVAGARSVPFDPAEPTRAVEAVAQALAERARRMTVITGARRGSGVSTLALHLACALGAGTEVCLIDLDPDSSLRARLALPDDARHWGDVRDGVLAAAIPHSDGFRLLLAPPNPSGDVHDVLTAAAARFEHVVVDAPPSPWRAVALADATSALLVVPPSRQGIAHAEKTVARHPNVAWSCIVNRLGGGGEITTATIGRALDRRVSLELPCSPYLRDREDDHRLLFERWSRYFRRVSRLAAAVA